MKPEKILFVFSLTLRATIVLAIISATLNMQWTVLFVSSLALILTFLPALFERNYKIFLPAEFEIIIVAFIYTAIFLGEVHSYYTKFFWWDIVLHAISSMVFGFIGFLILYVLYDKKKIAASPLTIAVFSFTFAVAIGALWEIFEFVMDSTIGLNMQKSGLVDTMWDLIVDSIGALVTSVLGSLYIKGGKSRIFEGMVNKFIHENPKLFGDKFKN